MSQSSKTLTAEQFIDTYVGAVYADDNDQLVLNWQKLPEKQYVTELASYVLDSGTPVNYVINEDASVTIFQSLMG